METSSSFEIEIVTDRERSRMLYAIPPATVPQAQVDNCSERIGHDDRIWSTRTVRVRNR